MLGPSGCGKTTLLRIIAGLETPDSGSIVFDNIDVTNLPPQKRGIGMVFQNYALWPHMTVNQNLSFCLEVQELSTKVKEERIKETLSMVSLSEMGKRYPHELSGGQQQRVALARALVQQPKLLLLDEPLSNLDVSLREEIRIQIRKIHKELGITMIFVSHDPEDVRDLATRAALMSKGTFVKIGTPKEVIS